MATDFRQIDLDDHQRHLLASAADQQGVPWPVVFEKAIAPLAEKKPQVADENGSAATPYEILARHGLIGCIEGTPADLSTNKKYMEGYGKGGERILIDTGPIVAILCREDADHKTCIEHLQSLKAELLTCWPVISEAVFLLGGRADRVKSLLDMLACGAIHIVSLGTNAEVIGWLDKFYDRFGQHAPDLADATLNALLAEQQQIQRIFTLDVRDFSVYRTSDNRALEIVGIAT